MSQVILLMRDRASTRPLRFLWGLSISIVGLAVVLQSVGSGLWAAWIQLESSAAQALQAAFLAGGATGLGALGVLVSKRRANSQETFKFLALSAGAMFSAALLSLLVPAVRITAVPAALDVVVAGIVGYAAMAALDRLLPHIHAAPRESGAWPSDSVRLMVVAIAVHNLPEGFAVGAGFGGDDALGWGTALSIGMQNIPEGLIVVTALWSIGTSRVTAWLGLMAALDTNILVRWLTNDDAKQCAIVLRLFDAAINKGERLFVTVMLEVEWVLRTKYHYDRRLVTAALNTLLDVTELEFQMEPALEQALWLFEQTGSRDFADCLHIALVSQTGHGSP